MVAVQLHVDALAYPGYAHQHEELQIEEELVLGQDDWINRFRIFHMWRRVSRGDLQILINFCIDSTGCVIGVYKLGLFVQYCILWWNQGNYHYMADLWIQVLWLGWLNNIFTGFVKSKPVKQKACQPYSDTSPYGIDTILVDPTSFGCLIVDQSWHRLPILLNHQFYIALLSWRNLAHLVPAFHCIGQLWWANCQLATCHWDNWCSSE